MVSIFSLQSCKEQVDAILFLFSFTDRGSFDDLSNQISRITESLDRVVKLVVGTKYPSALASVLRPGFTDYCISMILKQH